MGDMDSDKEYKYQGFVVDLTEMLAVAMSGKGLTYKDLAKLTGYKKSKIKKILGGYDGLKLREVCDMSLILGISIKFTEERKH